MYSILKDKKILIYTLGCKVNQYESDAMLEELMKHGCIRIADNNEFTENDSDKSEDVVNHSSNHSTAITADICIINTCSVTNMADRKSRQIIHRMRKQNPDAIIAATGCYVQIAGNELLEDGAIDLIIGNNRKKDVAQEALRVRCGHCTD